MGRHSDSAPGIGRDSEIVQLKLIFEVPAESPRVFSIIGDEGQWPEDMLPRILKREPNSRLQVAFPDFTRCEISLEPTQEGTMIRINHDLLKSQAQLQRYEMQFGKWFDAISKRVTQ